MLNALQNIQIDSIIIRVDEDGRYCINDLHKASGGERKNEPSAFFRNDKIKQLVQELSDTQFCVSPKINNLEPVKTVRGGIGEQGTYVVKELVYAYAMWISPSFHLKVIRIFDAVVSKQQTQQFALPTTYLQALESLVQSEKEKQALAAKIEQDAPKVEFATAIETSSGSVPIGVFAKAVKINGVKVGRNTLFKLLRNCGYLQSTRTLEHNVPYQKYIDNGWFEVKEYWYVKGRNKELSYTTRITGKGQIGVIKGLAKALHSDVELDEIILDDVEGIEDGN